MKVLIFHQYFGTSEDVGAGVRTYELGRRLVQHGDVVTIITGDLIYFSGSKSPHSPGLWSQTKIDGIDVIRVHVPFGGSHSILPRIIGFLCFIPLGFLAGLFHDKPDVVVATSTPLTIGIPGYMLSRLRGIPFVLELRDLWPDCVVAWNVVRSKSLIRAAYWLESFLYRKSQRIFTVTAGIRQELIRKGIDSRKIVLITNATDTELFTPDGLRADLEAIAQVPRDAFVCIHSGSVGFANRVDFLLEVAELLRHTPSIHFIILGAGPQKKHLAEQVARRQLSAIHFLEAVPKTEVPRFLRSADLGMVLVRPGPLTYIFLCNKFFDYLGCGLPVAVNFEGEASALLEAANAGLYLPHDDLQACAKAIRDLAGSPDRLQIMAANSRKLAETCFSWNHKAVDFRNAIADVLRERCEALPSPVRT